MTRLLGISGSLRQQSFNTSLLRAAQQQLPANTTLDIATLHGIPLYDGDLEARDGLPAAVAALKDQIRHSDGVILASPEYNNSLPGVFKNAIDWLSRPNSDIPAVFGNRPFTVISASPGGFGGLLSQTAWLPVLKSLGTRQWSGGSLLAARAHTLFNEQGELTDDALRQRLGKFLAGFVQFIDS